MKKLHLILIIIIAFSFAMCNKGEVGNNAPNTGAGGSTAMITIHNDYMYIVTQQTLQTWDISIPAKTVLLNEQYIGWDVETIFPYRDKLFIGSQSAMYVFDISNPKQPKQQGTVSHIRSCDPVIADEDYAFVTLRNNNTRCGGTSNVLNIYDIQGTNIMSPKLVSSLSLMPPYGLGKKNNVIYVCLGDRGLAIVDVSNKAKPIVIKTLLDDHIYMDVIPYGDLLIAYIEGGIVIYNISISASPKLLSTIKY